MVINNQIILNKKEAADDMKDCHEFIYELTEMILKQDINAFINLGKDDMKRKKIERIRNRSGINREKEIIII